MIEIKHKLHLVLNFQNHGIYYRTIFRKTSRLSWFFIHNTFQRYWCTETNQRENRESAYGDQWTMKQNLHRYHHRRRDYLSTNAYDRTENDQMRSQSWPYRRCRDQRRIWRKWGWESIDECGNPRSEKLRMLQNHSRLR